jgi:hypothetical protein
MRLRRFEYRVFDYAAKLALDQAAAVHREAGRMCQCGHLMHVGTCKEPNTVQSTPTAFAHAFCRCSRSRLMGEPASCAICNQPTQVINGIATIICESCKQKREELINRGLAAAAARRHRRGGRK